VKKDSERAQWVFVPHVGVGPLRFGMAPDEVSAALGSDAPVSSLVQRSSGNFELTEAQFTELGVNAYYGMGQALACIAVDVRAGQQVTLDGASLVARVPSEAGD
jgi:hypothetical protein